MIYTWFRKKLATPMLLQTRDAIIEVKRNWQTQSFLMEIFIEEVRKFKKVGIKWNKDIER
ncbi:MAG: hypothetical protein HQK53_20450 [Oligoflexia bacterium]|nr:hypothetical protein [Oligoflexia bacterium]